MPVIVRDPVVGPWTEEGCAWFSYTRSNGLNTVRGESLLPSPGLTRGTFVTHRPVLILKNFLRIHLYRCYGQDSHTLQATRTQVYRRHT